MIEQQPCKQQAEQHHQTSDQIGYASVPEDNTDEQTDTRRGEVEENKDQNEPEELRPRWNQARHRVHDDSHDDRWDQPQRHDVEDNLRSEIGDRVIVAVSPLTDKQQPLRGKNSQTGECAESEQSQDEEE